MLCVLALRKWSFLFGLVLTFKVCAIGVSPTRIELSPLAQIASLKLTNDSDEPVTMQLELVKWRQEQEQERFLPTNDIIATPQIFNIPPKGIQIVRFGLEKPLFGNQEKAYRVFIQEVISKNSLKPGQLKMALRLSLPIIIEPLTTINEKLIWKADFVKNKLRLVAHNEGNNILFINSIQSFSLNKKIITKPQTTFAYILPGSKKTWFLSPLNKEKPSLIKASINSKTVFKHVS